MKEIKLDDLTNKNFGILKVIKRTDDYISPQGKHQICWLCECQCGNTVKVVSQRLKSGKTKSCGCLVPSLVSKTHKKYNTYNLFGDYGVGYTEKGEKFYFDLEDYDKIKYYCWHIKNGYLVTNTEKTQIRMHRLIMNILDKKNIYIDHIDGMRCDNRKYNLRLSTKQQNNQNTGININNTSGYKGVSYSKDKHKWLASITYNNKQFFLGYFDDIEDAIKIRKTYELKYFKEFTRDDKFINNSVHNK